MTALLRAQALGGGQKAQGPNSGPLGLAARRAGGLPRPTLGPSPGSMPARMNRPGAPTLGGMSGRRGPPGGLSLSGMQGAPKAEDNKFTDFGKIMCVTQQISFLQSDHTGTHLDL
jgi:mitogen-activated protein kinase kinase